MKHHIIFAVLAVLLSPLAATAQDAQGRDTAGSWRVKHHLHFGPWDSVCDENGSPDALTERCYLRLVDVFSPRPKFAALFVFVTPSPDGHTVEFGIERGTRFAKGGFAIVDAAGTPQWSNTKLLCLTGFSCIFSGEEAATLIKHMQSGAAFRFEFTDRHAEPQSLSWPLAPFVESYEDYVAQSTARNLLN